ncbi:MAG: tetratricopeptide repeat protein, partial [Candidatus Nitrosopolaris sp.]
MIHNDSAANDNEGVALFNLSNQTALKYFDRAISLNSTNENAYFNRGAFFQSQGNYKKAIDDYNKTLVLNPND